MLIRIASRESAERLTDQAQVACDNSRDSPRGLYAAPSNNREEPELRDVITCDLQAGRQRCG